MWEGLKAKRYQGDRPPQDNNQGMSERASAPCLVHYLIKKSYVADVGFHRE